MHLKIDRNFLIEELTKCNRIIDNKSIVAYSMGIFVLCEVDCVSFISMNSQINIKSKVYPGQGGLEINTTGSFLIRGKYILEILKKMDTDFVTISKYENNMISLCGGKSEFTLNILDESEFPTLAFKEKGQVISVKCDDLKKALTQTLISVNEANQKLVLTGLNFKVENNKLFISGTDSSRISRKEILLNTNEGTEFETTIPLKTVLEIQKLLTEKGVCNISLMDNSCCFKIGDTLIQTNVLEGIFPNVAMVFPKDFSTKIVVENKKISKVISRADIPNDENFPTIVNVIVDQGKIIIKSAIQSIASFEEEFSEFSLTGIEDQNLYINPKLLLDALRTFEAKTVEILILDEKKPIVICSEEENSLKQIILPMSAN